MSCKYITEKCSICKKSDDYLVFSNDKPNMLDIDLYTDYINFNLQICPYCGYISTNIQNKMEIDFDIIQKSNEYQNAYKYMYLDSFKEIDKTILSSYPANLYECYAICCREQKNIDEEIRAYYKSVVLMIGQIKRYKQIMYEENEKSNDTLDFLRTIEKRISDNINKICELYEHSSKNLFTTIILFECYVHCEKFTQAKQIYSCFCNDISNEFRKYLDKKLGE